MALSMRRIFSVLTVAALMAAMMVASVMPAMAAPGNGAGNGAKHFDAVYPDGTDISGVSTPGGAANVTIQEHPMVTTLAVPAVVGRPYQLVILGSKPTGLISSIPRYASSLPQAGMKMQRHTEDSPSRATS